MCSALEEEHSDLSSVVHVEGRLCLACDLEGETLPHDAVPAGTELTVHRVLHEFACKLKFELVVVNYEGRA